MIYIYYIYILYIYWYEHKLHSSGGMTSSIVPSSRRPSPLAEASRTPPAPGRALREALETAANAKKKTHIARHIASHSWQCWHLCVQKWSKMYKILKYVFMFYLFLCDWIGFISRPRSSKHVGTCFMSEISWNLQDKIVGHCKAQCRTGSNQQQGTAGSHIITTSPCGQKETAWNSSVYTKKLKHCVFGETR